jgi:hypothetical protein
MLLAMINLWRSSPRIQGRRFSAIFSLVLAPFLFDGSLQAAGLADLPHFTQPGILSAWDGPNNPNHFGNNLERSLAELPLQGTVASHLPWSDSYWPTNRGGIANRWNWPTGEPGGGGFQYHLYTLEEVRGMSLEQLATLSPAEKYDIARGLFDYPMVKWIRKNSSPNAPYWAGICHGWALASIHHPEPRPILATSPQGIQVPFGSSDIKGLLSQMYADESDAENFLGVRCKINWLGKPMGCDDVNAGAFHIVLTNELGLRARGFVLDIDRYKEVWNQPTLSYETQLLSEREPSDYAAPGTVREVLVRTTLFYTEEITPRWEPVVGTPEFSKNKKIYEYALELGAQGEILGGSFSSWERPDFLWWGPKLEFQQEWAFLGQIYAKSQEMRP